MGKYIILTIKNFTKRHPSHLIDPSPWPIFTSAALFSVIFYVLGYLYEIIRVDCPFIQPLHSYSTLVLFFIIILRFKSLVCEVVILSNKNFFGKPVSLEKQNICYLSLTLFIICLIGTHIAIILADEIEEILSPMDEEERAFIQRYWNEPELHPKEFEWDFDEGEDDIDYVPVESYDEPGGIVSFCWDFEKGLPVKHGGILHYVYDARSNNDYTVDPITIVHLDGVDYYYNTLTGEYGNILFEEYFPQDRISLFIARCVWLFCIYILIPVRDFKGPQSSPEFYHTNPVEYEPPYVILTTFAPPEREYSGDLGDLFSDKLDNSINDVTPLLNSFLNNLEEKYNIYNVFSNFIHFFSFPAKIIIFVLIYFFVVVLIEKVVRTVFNTLNEFYKWGFQPYYSNLMVYLKDYNYSDQYIFLVYIILLWSLVIFFICSLINFLIVIVYLFTFFTFNSFVWLIFEIFSIKPSNELINYYCIIVLHCNILGFLISLFFQYFGYVGDTEILEFAYIFS